MQTVIIGGGISGLACAYRLRQLGSPVILFEQSSYVGGVLETAEKEGFLFELGPQSFLLSERLLELIAALGLEGELLRADPRAPRYVLLGGRLYEAPMSPPSLITTRLLGPGTKFRLLLEPLGRSQPPDGDESIAAFVARKFGADLLDHLVGPFVSGIYAGDPERLSLRSAFPAVYEWERAYGSVIRGVIKSRPAKGTPRPSLSSFRGGVASLVRALGDDLKECVRTGVSVESLRRGKANGKSRFDIRLNTRGRQEVFPADAVVLATQTEPAGRILAGLSTGFLELLRRIEFAPVAVVGGGYRREHVGHLLKGFGFLVPRKEGLRILGTVWSSSLFPGRAPEGMVSLASFAGGATDPKLAELPDPQIAELVEREVARILEISRPPVARVVKRYARALPQYNLGHSKILGRLREEVSRFPGLFLTGNYFEGPSIGTCVEQAFRTAQAAHEYISRQE